MDEEDPIQSAVRDGGDLYEIATWEERTLLDRVAVALYGGLVFGARLLVVLLALGILGSLFFLGGLSVVYDQPAIAALVALSALPAFGLAAYVWYVDATTAEPLWLLVATFCLGVLFATFAAVLNGVAQPLVAWVPVVGMPLFFYLVVGPVEESVKLLAVRLYAYTSDAFDSVVDGAVYGAMAGLGFATIENALYISQSLQGTGGPMTVTVIGPATGTAFVRALAGPGHVIYSAFAGYYLGLAKFNPENRGPIVVKGILVASLIHATYNTLTGVAPGVVAAVLDVTGGAAVVLFIVGYDGLFGFFLVRKILRYNRAYVSVEADQEETANSAAPGPGDADRGADDPDTTPAGGDPDAGGDDSDPEAPSESRSER